MRLLGKVNRDKKKVLIGISINIKSFFFVVFFTIGSHSIAAMVSFFVDVLSAASALHFFISFICYDFFLS